MNIRWQWLDKFNEENPENAHYPVWVLTGAFGNEAVDKILGINSFSSGLAIGRALIDYEWILEIAKISDVKFWVINDKHISGIHDFGKKGKQISAYEALMICDPDILEESVEKGSAPIEKRIKVKEDN